MDFDNSRPITQDVGVLAGDLLIEVQTTLRGGASAIGFSAFLLRSMSSG